MPTAQALSGCPVAVSKSKAVKVMKRRVLV
jgi:hypothetical protein